MELLHHIIHKPIFRTSFYWILDSLSGENVCYIRTDEIPYEKNSKIGDTEY